MKKGFLDRIPSFSLILIMVILMIIGVAVIPLVKISYMPSEGVKMQVLHVGISWNGASARVIEQEVTSKIEGLVSSVNGVESVTSRSGQGSANVSINVKKDANLSAVRFEISSLLKQIAPKLPKGVSYPYLSESSGSGQKSSKKTLLSYNIHADMQEEQIEDYAKKTIQPQLELIDGVEVRISGAVPKYIEMIYDPKVLESYGFSPSIISEGISNFLGKTQIVGDVEKSDEFGEKNRITLHLATSKSETELARIPLGKVDGKMLYLGDLVTLTYKDTEPESYFRINGLKTIYMSIEVDNNANLIAMSETIRTKVEEIKATLIDNYYVTLTYDSAKEIKAELYKLLRRTVLSLCILLVFVWLTNRNMRYLTIIAVTLLANVLIAFILYFLFNIELHLYSLAGIAVSFGLIIDTSIVMVDHYSYYKNRRVFLAILAALLTTIGSLIIIFFMPDYIKKDLYDFASIIIINLTVALVISLLFVPAIIDKYAFSSKETAKKVGYRRKLVKISRLYTRYITFTQKRKWIYILLFIIAFGIPFNLLPPRVGEPSYYVPKEEQKEPQWYHELYNKTIGGNFYQSKLKKPLEYTLGGTLRLFGSSLQSYGFSERNDAPVLQINASMPEGSTIGQLNSVLSEMENFLSQYEEISQFKMQAYGTQGSIHVEFKEEFHGTSFPLYLDRLVKSKAISIGGADWSIFGVDERGFSNALNLDHKSHRISINGYNYDRLYKYAEELGNQLKTNKRVTDIEIEAEGARGYYGSAGGGVSEMFIRYDMEKVALYNLNLSESYGILGGMLSRGSVGIYTENGSKTDMVLVSSQRDKFDVWNLFNSYLTVGDRVVKFSQIGEISKRKASSSILKKNQEYSIDIAFNFMGSYELSERFMTSTIEKVNASLPVGFSCRNQSFGWYQDTGIQYWLLFLIVIIIFFMCSILFESLRQPLVIISIIPLSFIGVFLTFYFSSITFGTGGFASMVLLSGLVVNAAIYIVNEYNIYMRLSRNNSLVKIYVKAFNHKIIPVLLTILSTVLGLIPFLLDGKKEQFWFSFAIGTTGGLLFSIVALFFIMPILMPLKKK